jgi:hypothetical protein
MRTKIRTMRLTNMKHECLSRGSDVEGGSDVIICYVTSGTKVISDRIYHEDGGSRLPLELYLPSRLHGVTLKLLSSADVSIHHFSSSLLRHIVSFKRQQRHAYI